MTHHFAAFSFVDRIDVFEPATRARATFAIPAQVDAFPSCLVAEAVGQLAAWVAMARIDFRGRPVAALANETRFLRSARPGDTLALAVEIEHCDDEAVAYHGHADIGGVRAIELVDCLGPMLPLDEFDDPAALRAWLGTLVGSGATPGRFRGIDLAAPVAEPAAGSGVAQAVLEVPRNAAFFDDHFPRRPVFPATLLLDAQIAVALRLARTSGPWASDTALAPRRMTHVKVRAFTPPGSTLRLSAQLRDVVGDEGTFLLTAEGEGRTVATARVVIGPAPSGQGVAP